MIKKKKFLLASLSFTIVLFITLNLVGVFKEKEINIQEILSNKYYSYLPNEAKEYIQDVYEESGIVLLTEKNKKVGLPYLNPDYVSYLTNGSDSESGYVPSSFVTDIDFEALGAVSDDLPSKYDLRDVNGVSYVTSMKDQLGFDLCWDFAATGALESKILKEGLYTGSGELDLSENQVDYVTSSPEDAIDIGKNPYISNNYTRSIGAAGASLVYINAILNGVSPIYEKDWKYDYDYTGKLSPEDVWNNENVYYDVDGVYEIRKEENPDENFINNMKNLIMEHGALAVGIPVIQTSVSYEVSGEEEPLIEEKTKNTLYYRSENYPYPNGHDVMVIGWNDNYSHNICINTSSPFVSNATYSFETGSYSCSKGSLKTINGAWIAKNSYGSDSNTAYFYIAFESHNLSYANFYDVDVKKWDNAYYSNSKNYSTNSYSYKKLDISEKVEKIKFSTTNSNTTATIKISLDGSTTYTEVGQVAITYPGLYTLDLVSQNILLNSNTFNVKIEFPTSVFSGYDGVSVFTSNNENNINIEIEDAKIEQSFIYQGLIEQENIVILNGKSRNLNTQNDITYKVFDNNQVDVTSSFTFYRNYSVSNYINTMIGFDNNVKKGDYVVYCYVDGVKYDEFSLTIDSYFENVEGIGSESDPYIITNATQLNMVRTSSSSFYKLGNNIDLLHDTYDSDGMFYNDGKGWEPIDFDDFNGGFDGNNYQISNLYINRPLEDYVGLFSKVYGGGNYADVHVKNLTLVNPNIKGKKYVGGISGYVNGGNNQRCMTLESLSVKHGTINGQNYVGGVLGGIKVGSKLTGYCVPDGQNRHTVNSLYNSATINSSNYSAGIIGVFDGMPYEGDSPAYISNIQNNGKIISNNIAVGLIGLINESGANSITINNAINTGKLNGLNNYDLVGEFTQSSTGILTLNNMYYLGNTAYPKVTGIESNNISQKTINELKNEYNYTNWENFSDKWKIEVINNIKRTPVLKFVDFDYTTLNKTTLTNNENIYSLVSPDYEAVKNITYEIEDSSIATINEDGTVNSLKSGETTISILSNYDGFEGNVSLSISDISNIMYGDVNEDGKINSNDAQQIIKYLNNAISLNEQAKKNADVNADGKISQTDSILILNHLSGMYENTLPNSPIKDYVMYGDANEDGVVDSEDSSTLKRYLKGQSGVTISEQGLKNADINNDNAIDKQDVYLILLYSEQIYDELPITEYKIVYYDGNYAGWQWDMSNFQSFALSEGALNKNTITRDGYTFDGWNTKADGSGTKYVDEATIDVENGMTTLYAQWKKSELTFEDETKELTFSNSSQTITITGAGSGSGNYTYEEVSESNGSNATDYFSINGTTITVKANTPANTYTYEVKATDTTTQVTENKTVTIVINPKTITITFTKGENIASIGETSKTCEMRTSVGCSVTMPPITANSGYKVLGWGTTVNGTNVKEVGSIVNVTRNITYYAIAVNSLIEVDDYVISNEYIKNIDENTTVTQYIEKFDVSSVYEIKLFNSNDEELENGAIVYTGCITKIYLNNELIESYVNIVSGDVTGDGLIKMNDIMKLATYVIDNSIIKESYYIAAGDFTGDSNIKMNDVMKLATYVLGGEE